MLTDHLKQRRNSFHLSHDLGQVRVALLRGNDIDQARKPRSQVGGDNGITDQSR